ncbi:MAG: hypothetical protein ACXVB4_17020, partial [Pseudobdellovibrionaceae bacterium]
AKEAALALSQSHFGMTMIHNPTDRRKKCFRGGRHRIAGASAEIDRARNLNTAAGIVAKNSN